MDFFESLIQNFRSKNISSQNLMGLSKAYYLLDNYKKITYEGYLRLDIMVKNDIEDIQCYFFRIYSDEAILGYEGYVNGPCGGDSVSDEIFNFNYDPVLWDEAEDNIDTWINQFEMIFNMNGTISIEDGTEDIEEIEEEEAKDYEEE
jgi:hypothetical protein